MTSLPLNFALVPQRIATICHCIQGVCGVVIAQIILYKNLNQCIVSEIQGVTDLFPLQYLSIHTAYTVFQMFNSNMVTYSLVLNSQCENALLTTFRESKYDKAPNTVNYEPQKRCWNKPQIKPKTLFLLKIQWAKMEFLLITF